MNSENLNSEQLEIIGLLRCEFEEIAEVSQNLKDMDTVSQCEQLNSLGTQMEQIASAAELSGLTGLSETCKFIEVSIAALTYENTFSKADIELFGDWPKPIIDYLDQLAKGENTTNCVQAIIEHLSSPAWQTPLSSSTAADLMASFIESNVNLLADETEEIPNTALPEMVSLSISDDVRPDLVEGMLLELPEQVRQFESSVNRYLTSQDFDQLSQAQRMAHTLKGAANIVGIPGIANLMHYTEDLLETAAKHEDVDASFGELLLDASDCLAMMGEYLCGLGAPPTNSLEVLQALLDWLQHLKGNTLDFSALAQEEKVDINNSENIDQEATVTKIENTEAPNPPPLINTSEFDNPNLELSEDGLLSESLDFDDAENVLVEAQSDSLPSLTPSETHPKDATAPTQNTPIGEDVEEKHRLNLPESTAHELLRIAGESQIANTQVMAQVDALQASIQLTDRFHNKIKSMSAELEALAQTQSVMRAASMQYNDDEIDPLEMERYSELQSFSHQLLELTTDSHEAILHIENQIRELSSLAYSQKQLNQDSQDILLEMRMVPVDLLSSRFSRCVRQATRLTGKAAKLEITGEELLLDSRVLNRISDPIMHLLRNAVDHGLEHSSEIRLHAGKTAEATISLEFAMSGETVSIRCRDDGKGLDYDKIHTLALEKGLLDKDAESPPDKDMLNQFILMPGFTTRSQVSQTSGRGIGLDAVIAEVKALKGTLNVESQEGQGSCFTINVPTSILTGHALVVRSTGNEGTQLLSIVARSVDQIIYIKPEQIIYENDQAFYNYLDQRIPVYDINDLTNIHNTPGNHVAALLISKKLDGSIVGIAVEAVLASQSLVIKPLNHCTYRPEGVIGATILGDGTVSPVIDLQELPGMSLSQEAMATLRQQRAQIAALESEEKLEPPSALIVDDSLSARRSLAQFISDIGMEVHTARDGFEAISAINEKKPALLLVDLEMPKMNGLELTAHIRSREDTRDIPIIMITSRTAEKHRDLAKNAGVDTYINKPWSDEELLNSIQQQIA